MESHNIESFVTSFFHLACFQGSSLVHFFLLQNNIPLYRYTMFSLAIHQLKDT